MQVTHPSTHGDKLRALSANNNLPSRDKDRIESALERYYEWIEVLKGALGEGDELLRIFVDSLNSYKRFIDLNLIYDAEDSFLYRQNGQLKLSNSVLEEFLPYLFDARLVPGFERLGNIVCGPHSSFAGLSFGSPFLGIGASGGVFLKTKDQDFSVAKIHHMTITDDSVGGSAFSKRFYVSHFATEIKTNLDKTMFQEASQTSNELKRAVPGSRYVLLCEYLDMTPITTKLTSIDEVVVLRKAKRLASNIRAEFSTSEGRRRGRDAYVRFLDASPLHFESFKRFVSHINECFPETEDDTLDTVLGRGYF